MTDSQDALADVIADPLVLGAIHGDRAAWFQLTLHIEAWVHDHVPRHWRMRKARLAGSEDDLRDVLLETLERLDRHDFKALRDYLERKVEQVPDVRGATAREGVTFVTWLAALVDFAIRAHVRRRYGRTPVRSGDEAEPAQPALSKRSLNSWALHPSETQSGHYGSAHAGLSRILTARSILGYAADTFEAHELALFQRYLDQASFEELAQEFCLVGSEEARAQVRRLKERLRARFREAQ